MKKTVIILAIILSTVFVVTAISNQCTVERSAEGVLLHTCGSETFYTFED